MCVYVCVFYKIYCKELARMIMEAEKCPDLPSARAGDPGKPET